MKIKVIIIFLLALGTVGFVGYISYVALSRLMVTLESTVQPDRREQQLKTLLYHISESENAVRIFTITRETRYLNSYRETVKESNEVLDDIFQKSAGDTYTLQHLDTVKLLLQRKTYTQNRLIRLAQEQRRINVYDDLLLEIDSLEERNEAIDSMKTAILKAETTLEKEIALKQEEINFQKEALNTEEPGFFQKIFGGRKKIQDQLAEQNQQIAETTKELDTLLAAKDTLHINPDSLQTEDITQELALALQEIKNREDQINKELTEIELTLTRRDRIIGLELQNQTEQIFNYFDQLDKGEARAAGSYFDKVTSQITIVGSVFAMLFFALILIILNDIKVNQRFRKQLEEAKIKAEKLAQAKDEFLSNMSHEIRTPLNAIIGFIEQVKMSDLNRQQEKFLGIIHNASSHLLSLINDILDYAKIEAGKVKLEKQPFSIVEQTTIVFETLRAKAEEKGIEFNMDFGTLHFAQYVLGDPVRYRQIIFNLVDNAIKFTDNGSVSLFLNYDSKWLEIKVVDSGIGIPEKNLKSIYEKFDQVSQKRKYEGTGLGLSIVKRLVDLQKGSIQISSVEHEGTEFIVKLPFQPTDQPDKKILSDQENLHLNENAKILIVDDESFNRTLIETILNKQKVKCCQAHSGNVALELFAKEKFDVLLLDLQLKELHGIEVAKRIREELNSEVPLIAITASVGQEIHRKCLQAGFNEVLIKPILERDLLNALQKYIGIETGDNREPKQIEQPDSEDTSNFSKMFEDNAAFALKMARIYEASLQGALSNFQSDGMDWESIRKSAHKIIPSSRQMGFDDFAILLKKLEKSIEENGNLEDTKLRLTAVINEGQAVQKQILDYLRAQKSSTQ